ncbi:MAG TPA: SRPBCC domain-containing protein [Devosiaceae bacterium]|jgi:uncharacterized protein YndB with AHSA1/START domain
MPAAPLLRPIPDDELLINRTFDAPVALVYRVWTRPEFMVRWWGPREFTCPGVTMDFREGGAWRASIRSVADGESHMSGIYREIVPNQRLVFTFRWELEGALDTVITVTFTEKDGKTLQSFHQTPFRSVAERDSHIGGWTECLVKQEAYVEGQAA